MTTRHRGRHAADAESFAPGTLDVLRRAVYELSWLLGRGYSPAGALQLVGDRYQLVRRQRRAVMRSACSDAERSDRTAKQRRLDDLAGAELRLDGFNCIITTEAALSGGIILVGRDGAHRDLASVHGSYRKVAVTERAVELIGAALARAEVSGARWYLDRPVSNSGRLRALLLDVAERGGFDWDVELVDSPDHEVVDEPSAVTASSDAKVLDGCSSWIDLPAAVIAEDIPDAWLVDLGGAGEAMGPESKGPRGNARGGDPAARR